MYGEKKFKIYRIKKGFWAETGHLEPAKLFFVGQLFMIYEGENLPRPIDYQPIEDFYEEIRLG